MQYTTLGASGLVVSRLALGMMSYGDTSRRAWHLEFDDAEPIVRAAVEAGVTFFDTADMYDLGASEQVTGTLLSRLFGRRDDYVLATKVFFPMGAGRTDGGCRANTCCRPSTPPCVGSARTTSTSTRSIGGTTRPRSRRRCRCLTTSCGPARSATSALRACTPGSSPRHRSPRGQRLDARSCRCRTTTTWPTARKSGR